MFKPSEGDFVVLRVFSKRSTTYFQCDLYTYNGHLFAKKGNSFILLYENNHTSCSNITWENPTRFPSGYGKTGKALA
jgi:hypothetical protein